MAVYGFGYDQETEDCKLVVMFNKRYAYFMEKRKACCRTYGLRSETWGPVREKSGLYLYEERSSLCNAALHWIGPIEGDDDYSVVAFDLATEEWHEVAALPVPDNDYPWASSCPWRLNALDDSLYVIFAKIEVWMLKSEGTLKSWNKLFSNAENMKPITTAPLGYAEVGRKILGYDDKSLKWYDMEKEETAANRVAVIMMQNPDSDDEYVCIDQDH